jgi:hypothetical protein
MCVSSIPGGVIAFVIVAIFLPTSQASSKLPLREAMRRKMKVSRFQRIDAVGMVLLLASSILLVFALEEGGTAYSWSSATVIAPLVIAVVAGIVFVFWEIRIDKPSTVQEPVFPPSMTTARLPAATLLTAFAIGFPFVAVVVNIPQRAQAVSGLSPIDAGLALLPLMLSSPFATALSGFLTSNFKVPPLYLVLVGGLLQIVGVGLTCSLPTKSTMIPRQQYGFEVLMGLGFGLGLTTLITFARLVASEAHMAVMMGALTQVRVLAGTISLAIWYVSFPGRVAAMENSSIAMTNKDSFSASIFNNHLRDRLPSIISADEIAAISDSLTAIEDLSPEVQAAVRQVFAEGYNEQNIFLTAMTGVGLVIALFLWERNPRKVV